MNALAEEQNFITQKNVLSVYSFEEFMNAIFEYEKNINKVFELSRYLNGKNNKYLSELCIGLKILPSFHVINCIIEHNEEFFDKDKGVLEDFKKLSQISHKYYITLYSHYTNTARHNIEFELNFSNIESLGQEFVNQLYECKKQVSCSVKYLKNKFQMIYRNKKYVGKTKRSTIYDSMNNFFTSYIADTNFYYLTIGLMIILNLCLYFLSTNTFYLSIFLSTVLLVVMSEIKSQENRYNALIKFNSSNSEDLNQLPTRYKLFIEYILTYVNSNNL